ncbi:tyrosinase [Mycena vitilis]|nr:tyrosinase [Mycena vitilis]
MSKYIVTGAKGGSPPPGVAAPNRIEINDFVKIEDQFSLYIQALQHMYGQKQEDVDSFFAIAGIHGLPYQPWDGSGAKPVNAQDRGGYCTHGNVLFPTFHRPYVLLFEQALQTAAIGIAATYTVDQARFKQAALSLRQPYWDWAQHGVPPPEVISLDTVSIIAPDGQKIQVANPLRRYTFHPVDPSFPNPYSGWNTTLRWPNKSGATERISVLTGTSKSAQSQLKTKTYNLLTRVHTWPAFSNHTPGDSGSSSNSLEAIHDSVHLDIGGNGQMADPSVAAFDPIFFLHHSNVDRILSLWSALNPGVWVSPGKATGGTWTIAPNAAVDNETDLTPFRNSQDTYWRSSQVISTTALGYTYPEFNGLNMGDANAVQIAIAQKVNQLYGRSSALEPFATGPEHTSAPTLASSEKKPDSTSLIVKTVTIATLDAILGTSALPPSSADSGPDSMLPPGAHPQANVAQSPAHHGPLPQPKESKIWEWTARIQVKKYEVGGSFLILLFLGSVPDDPAQWRESTNFVGAHHVFANSVPERCGNCRTNRDAAVEGFVHLNDGIAELSGLDSFDPIVMEPYLHANLHWRVQKASGEVVDLLNVPSLEVAVLSTPVAHPAESPFPVPGESRHHRDITHGRRGGSRAV